MKEQRRRYTFYDKFGKKPDYVLRKCLRCDKEFLSESPFNRSCEPCKRNGDEQEVNNKVSLQTR